MQWLDPLVVAIYFVAMIALGFYFMRRAASDAGSYFLGGNRLHWLALSMSGSVSTFDITGTMWIVSILVLFGMKSMWHHWMWGFLMGAFFMAYMGKWVRRSGVMTAAEWMTSRFGPGTPGRVARATYAFMAVIFTAGAIGYAYQGIGKFSAVYVPLEQWLPPWLATHEADVLAIGIIGATTLYVMAGGLYGVVVTDVIQTVILTFSSLYIAYLAWHQMTPEAVAALPADFTSLAVPWRIPEMAGTAHANYEFFGALVMVWVVKGFLLNAGGPGQMYDFQRFLAARDPRDAAKVGATWSVFLIVRWGMAMGIALLALTSAMAVDDPEQVMPTILRDYIPVGLRGVVIAGLLAAFMSTFSSTINCGASFVVRDLWQLFLRPNASGKETVRVGYAATLGLVVFGILLGYTGESINQVWSWLMMALGAAVVVPNVLRWYWWRLNGWGYAAGTLGGILLALLAWLPDAPREYVMFPLITAASLVLSVAVSLLTAPTPAETLQQFYTRVRPFGVWGKVRRALPELAAETCPRGERATTTVLNVILASAAVIGAYLAPMYLVGHWYTQALAWGSVFAAAAVALYFTWYRNLPPAGEDA